jgi:hypothetical protein
MDMGVSERFFPTNHPMAIRRIIPPMMPPAIGPTLGRDNEDVPGTDDVVGEEDKVRAGVDKVLFAWSFGRDDVIGKEDEVRAGVDKVLCTWSFSASVDIH